DWEHDKHKRLFGRRDEWLDDRPAVRHLEQPVLAASVQRAIYHFEDIRYHILAYAIMPSHLHWVFHPLSQWCAGVRGAGWKPAPRPQRTPRTTVSHRRKGATAKEANRPPARKGAFWQAEPQDLWV